jgi:hypothetical protein
VPRTRRFTVGILLAGSLVIAFATAAASALAAPAHLAPARTAPSKTVPASTGSFLTWRAAQHAAGFALRRPSKTYGLTRTGGILVERCPAAGERRKRDVIATYGSFQHRLLGIQQNNSGATCVTLTGIHRLHTYHVDGVTAHLWGRCHVSGTPSCKTRKMWLFLSWRRHGIFYLVTSHNVRRVTIVGFARSLAKVGG